jgi:paraquat-inducible protein A
MLIACPDCAAIQEMPPQHPDGNLLCWRCDAVLEYGNKWRSLDFSLVGASTTFLMLLPANVLTVLLIYGPANISASTHIFSGVFVMWAQRWPLLAIACALLTVILPFLRYGLLTVTLFAIWRGSEAKWIGPAFRWAHALDLWAMPDVLLLGAALGVGRVINFIPVHIEFGGYCFIAAACLSLLTRASLDRRAIWRLIKAPPAEAAPDSLGCTSCDLVLPARLDGKRCPRCAAKLYRRKPDAVIRCLALTVAGYILLPIANYYPMSTLHEAGIRHPHTIFRGIELLFEHGYTLLGVVITFTSLFIPFGKLLVLTWLVISVETNSHRSLRRKTQLYRLVDEYGRWSNLDPFTILIFSPMVQFGSLAHIQVGLGSTLFMAVVLISIVATRAFDPRLVWDAACYPEQTMTELATELIHPKAEIETYPETQSSR